MIKRPPVSVADAEHFSRRSDSRFAVRLSPVGLFIIRSTPFLHSVPVLALLPSRLRRHLHFTLRSLLSHELFSLFIALHSIGLGADVPKRAVPPRPASLFGARGRRVGAVPVH